jgi:hypothetical protein
MLGVLEEIVVRALHAPDPPAALREEAARRAGELTERERAMLAAVDPDGFRLTALIVKKLRFQRILRGDVGRQAEFDADPEGFSRRFSDYLRQVPPEHLFARDEKIAFAKWRAQH